MQQPMDGWLTTQEAAAVIGCSDGWLRKMAKTGVIQRVMRGKQAFFSQADVTKAKQLYELSIKQG